ncbi:MAG TPA: cytochrome P460 family protein [Candidatus Acidoferrum sp.]|nr:cytochrome P460 family protein [Candidatus Acidoferrum sp.]
MTFHRTLALVVVLAVVLVAQRGNAGPDKIAFPENYKDGVLYAVIDRYDVKQFRELYGTAAAVQAAREGKPIPSGSVLTLVQFKAQVDGQGNPIKDANGRFVKGDLIAYTVMEKRAGWGTEYPDDLRNGDWEYAAFGADRKLNDKANYKGCFQCHKPHEAQDFVISLAKLAGKFPAGAVAAKTGATDVNINGFAFGPAKLVAPAGSTVTWINADDSPHQVNVASAKLRTAVLLRGHSAGLTFKDAGVFEYACALHPGMKGTVEVTK